jgi:ATP-dependent DNA helicase RecG
VLVFADRIEIWNLGELPPGLTPELLREPHGPMPRNPLIAEPLFRVQYVEKAGTGTTDMATRDLADLKNRKIVDQVGSRGPGVHYVLWRKGDKMETTGT